MLPFLFQLQEEIAMRDLVEQDSKEKIDNLRKEILEMKYVSFTVLFIQLWK